MRILATAFLTLAVLPSTVQAQDRDFCPDRPGISTPACTLSPGETAVEFGMLDWTLDRDSDERQDTFVIGNTLLRHGIADHAEIQVESGFGFSRDRQRASGDVEHDSSIGDVTIALRRNLASPDGSGFSVAVMPFVTLPVGREPIGAGDWAAGVLVPLSYELSDRLSLVTTTELEAAVDEDGDGRHFAFSEVIGAAYAVNDSLTATAEYQALFDHDPEGHVVEHVAGLAVGWQPAKDFQLDLGAIIGLDRDAPDAEVYFGVSRRF